MPIGSSSQSRAWIWPILLVALVLLTYANSLRNAPGIDDGIIYYENHFVRSPQNMRHLFTQDFFQYSNEATYRPVATATYFGDAALWRTWKTGPRLTNLALHIVAVLVLLALFRDVTGNTLASFTGAAIFAVHPLGAEVVNNIGFREELLTAILLPLSWLAFRRGERDRPWLWIGFAWLLYFVATMNKESAVVFPALALLLDYAHRGRVARPSPLLLRFVGGLVACTVLFAFIRFDWMRFPLEAETPRLGGSLLGTALAAVKIQAQYLRLFFFPLSLSSYYPLTAYAPRLDSVFFLSSAILVLVFALLFRLRRHPLAVFGFLWWFVCMAPVSNLYPIFNPMAERYLFLPSIGLCLLAGWAVAKGLETRARTTVAAAFIALVTAFAARTMVRNVDWRNEVTIWADARGQFSEDAMVESGMAMALYRSGQYDAAVEYGIRALELARDGKGRIDPVPVLLALGAAQIMRGELDTARAYLEQAKARLPSRADIDAAVYYNLGLIHDARGNIPSAEEHFRKAADIKPLNPETWRKLTACYLQQERWDAACDAWERVREFDPSVLPYDRLEALYRRQAGLPAADASP